jgi:hypothetical protein
MAIHPNSKRPSSDPFPLWKSARLLSGSHGARTFTSLPTTFTSGGPDASAACFAPLCWEPVPLREALLTESQPICWSPLGMDPLRGIVYSTCSINLSSFQTCYLRPVYGEWNDCWRGAQARMSCHWAGYQSGFLLYRQERVEYPRHL